MNTSRKIQKIVNGYSVPANRRAGLASAINQLVNDAIAENDAKWTRQMEELRQYMDESKIGADNIGAGK